MTLPFLFRWKHADGSIVEFSDQGWGSDDPEKNEWLNKMSQLSASYPVLSPAIRMWLRENCHLIEFSGQEGSGSPIRVDHGSGNEIDKLEALAGAADGGDSPDIRDRIRLLARTRRKAKITARTISMACDNFFRSRGMPSRENFNRSSGPHSMTTRITFEERKGDKTNQKEPRTSLKPRRPSRIKN
jgi:hypothetical protein